MIFLKGHWILALVFVIVALFVNMNLTSVWYSVSRPPLPGQPDLPVVILSYFTSSIKLNQLWYDLLYVRFLQGSAVVIRYLLIPLLILPVLYIAQTIIHRKYPRVARIMLYVAGSVRVSIGARNYSVR